MEELKKYFEKYILESIVTILLNQRIYKDFQKNCISKEYKVDCFTKFVDVNYYKAMITDLCRLLERGKQADDKNFRNFIELFKKKESIIIESRSKIPTISLDTGTIKEIDFSEDIQRLFDKVEHDKKISELDGKFQIFREYRNKVNCHQTSTEKKPPTMEDIDATISLLEDLLLIYAKLFGICLCTIIPKPIYRNPPLLDIPVD